MSIKKTLSSIYFVICLVATMSVFSFCSFAGESSVEVQNSCYEMSGMAGYKFDSDYIVDSMSYGAPSAGRLIVSGNDIETSSINGITAYGVNGNVSFSYEYNSDITVKKKNNWYVVDDREKKFMNRKFDGDIMKGVMIIEKSADGVHYEDAVNPVLNFFNSETSRVPVYTTKGTDREAGTYYRVILGYETEPSTHMISFGVKRHIEVYDFYIVENSGTYSIHNLSVDEELLESEEYSQELLKQGETLVDQSITRDGFSIGNHPSSYTITVQKDNDSPKNAKTDEKFTKDGKYLITTKTKLGKTFTQTIVVFNGGSDKGYKTYFGDGLVEAERLFREEAVPVYARNGKLHIQKVAENVPVLTGNVKNLQTGKTVYTLTGGREDQKCDLLPGKYMVDLYNGDKTAAGSVYHYTFTFIVIDEDSAPYVNYHDLSNREELEDLQTKHYEVTYPTTTGGYIGVCFDLDSYDEALKYAREIEGRFVENASGGGYYYKSEHNPNKKIKYYDQTELTRVSEIYAKQNIEIEYFNPLDQFTYQTYDNDFLDKVEMLTLPKSVKIFPSQKEKDKLLKRAPYLNDFELIQAADYDVVKAEAECENTGEVIDLEFGKPIKEQLKETSNYKITETNKYGKTTEYEGVFVNACQTKSKWLLSTNGEETEYEITPELVEAEGGRLHIEADSAYVSDIENAYDEWAIVTIKADDVYSFELKSLISEFKDTELNKAGTYVISFIDRLGNHYDLELVISGKIPYKAKKSFSLTLTDLYNRVYMNHQDPREDYTDLSVLLKERAEEQAEVDAKIDEEIQAKAQAVEETSQAVSESTDTSDIDEDTEGSKKNPAGIIILLMLLVGAGAAVWKKDEFVKIFNEKALPNINKEEGKTIEFEDEVENEEERKNEMDE